MRWLYPSCLTSRLDMCVQLCNYFEHEGWCPHVCNVITFPVLLLNWWRAGSGCAFCTFSGSNYTVHPAPPLGVTRIHSLPFISCLPDSSTLCVLASWWAPQRVPTSICHSCSIPLQSPAFGPFWCLTPTHCHSFLIPSNLPISITIRVFFFY